MEKVASSSLAGTTKDQRMKPTKKNIEEYFKRSSQKIAQSVRTSENELQLEKCEKLVGFLADVVHHMLMKRTGDSLETAIVMSRKYNDRLKELRRFVSKRKGEINTSVAER